MTGLSFGYGIGLPLSRLHARYLGGSLDLVSQFGAVQQQSSVVSSGCSLQIHQHVDNVAPEATGAGQHVPAAESEGGQKQQGGERAAEEDPRGAWCDFLTLLGPNRHVSAVTKLFET